MCYDSLRAIGRHEYEPLIAQSVVGADMVAVDIFNAAIASNPAITLIVVGIVIHIQRGCSSCG